jgi:hypothetical protein
MLNKTGHAPTSRRIRGISAIIQSGGGTRRGRIQLRLRMYFTNLLLGKKGEGMNPILKYVFALCWVNTLPNLISWLNVALD